MKRIFAAVDNGCTGTIGAVSESGDWSFFMPVPTYRTEDYNRTKVKHTTHVDFDVLSSYLKALMAQGELSLVTERPLKNPRLFNATMSGIRAHEILLAVTRSLGVQLAGTMDSRDWQVPMCGIFEKGESKPASAAAGALLFPEHEAAIRKHGDADGLLMAEFHRRRVLAEEAKTEKETEE